MLNLYPPPRLKSAARRSFSLFTHHSRCFVSIWASEIQIYKKTIFSFDLLYCLRINCNGIFDQSSSGGRLH
nr:hypothetical protein CFP56_05059 [Quercus suber]